MQLKMAEKKTKENENAFNLFQHPTNCVLKTCNTKFSL